MRFIILAIFLLIASFGSLSAQNIEGGLLLGNTQYFGDLNPKARFNSPRWHAQVMVKYNVDDRFVLRGNMTFGRLYYSDRLSGDAFNARRNLSFRTNILEVSGGLEFNFLEFSMSKKSYRFSPYLFIGLGFTYFNPQAELGGEWYDLQPLGTEGQNDLSYSNVKPYKLVAPILPTGFGFKYNLSRKINVGIEYVHRIAFTDYLDDVGGVYPSPLSLPDGGSGVAAALSDRSGEVGAPIGDEGFQRATSSKRDAYLMGGFWLTYLLSYEKCPKISRLP